MGKWSYRVTFLNLRTRARLWPASRRGHFNLWKEPRYQLDKEIGQIPELISTLSGGVNFYKLPGIEPRFFDRPDSIQFLYLPSYHS
jgi:hypothetical protein